MPTTCPGANAHRTQQRSPPRNAQRSGVQSSSVSQTADDAEPPPPRQTTSHQSQRVERSQTSPTGRRSAPHAMQRSQRQSDAEESRELSRLQSSSAHSKQRAAATEHTDTPSTHRRTQRRQRRTQTDGERAHRHAHARMLIVMHTQRHTATPMHTEQGSLTGGGGVQISTPPPARARAVQLSPYRLKIANPPCRR